MSQTGNKLSGDFAQKCSQLVGCQHAHVSKKQKAKTSLAPLPWMHKTLHRFEAMGNHYSLVFAGESSESRVP